MSTWGLESSRSVHGDGRVMLRISNGMGLECANAIGDMEIFGVVLIGGAIVHPR